MQYTIRIEKIDEDTYDIHATAPHGEVLTLSKLCPPERELRLFESALKECSRHSEHVGIVLFGVGSGIIEKELQKHNIPYLILDSENIKGQLQEQTPEEKEENSTDAALKLQSSIFKWQIAHKGIGFVSILHPFHKKISHEYNKVAALFANNIKHNLFKESRSIPRFEKNRPIRMLVIPDYYCMTVSLTNAAKQLGVEVRDVLINDHHIDETWYVKFLKTLMEFQPDFILTFNHLGIIESYNGVVTNLAESLGIPIASWFVDSPDVLIGYEGKHLSSLIHVFLWEKTRVEQVQALGYQASYLPLAADPLSFYPVNKRKIPRRLQKYKGKLVFVGAVSVKSLINISNRNIFPYKLYTMLPDLCEEFVHSSYVGIKEYLDNQDIPEYHNLSNAEKKEFSAYFFFSIHTDRRVQFMKAIADLNPIIAGEEGWSKVLPSSMLANVLPVVDYVLDLTCVYQLAEINLNVTSPQMKHAVNQRVFDVPISEAFVLTDNQPALYELFDVGKEVIAYHSIEEFRELYNFYIKNPNARKKIIMAGKKRILSEHLYAHRLQQMIDTMRAQFGIRA